MVASFLLRNTKWQKYSLSRFFRTPVKKGRAEELKRRRNKKRQAALQAQVSSQRLVGIHIVERPIAIVCGKPLFLFPDQTNASSAYQKIR